MTRRSEVRDRGREVEEYSRLPSVQEDLIGDAELRLNAAPDPIPLAAVYEGSGV